jgi:hypothetical protein
MFKEVSSWEAPFTLAAFLPTRSLHSHLRPLILRIALRCSPYVVVNR